MNKSLKSLIVIVVILFIVIASAMGGALADRLFVIKPLDYLTSRKGGITTGATIDRKIVNEESVVTKTVEDVSPSVVTVSIETPQRQVLQFDIFRGLQKRTEGGSQQDIGSGFIVSADGLIVTNKHVVADKNSTYKVVTSDDKEYEVKDIARDPANDIAVLKIDATGLKPIPLGASDNLKVGQFVVAIGTALGEFRQTVTTGVVSGLGRGITAGSAFEGFVEQLDDVIQTDAAINPGNSGGPLLNSLGQVIGINVAVAQGAENIGFAIPVDTVKKSLNQYQSTGHFTQKPFLGVEYQMITQRAALLQEVPQGALVTNIVEGSPAQKAGIQVDDIIVKIDDEALKDKEGGVADVITKKKVGDKVKLEIYRNNENITLEATLASSEE